MKAHLVIIIISFILPFVDHAGTGIIVQPVEPPTGEIRMILFGREWRINNAFDSPLSAVKMSVLEMALGRKLLTQEESIYFLRHNGQIINETYSARQLGFASCKLECIERNHSIIRVFDRSGNLSYSIPFVNSILITSIMEVESKKMNYSTSLFLTKKNSIVVLRGVINQSMDLQSRFSILL